jgi:outer membrane biosynthesis protein TonB
MSRPFSPLLFVTLGLAIASLPFFGFPIVWETLFEVAVGAGLIFMGLMVWWASRMHHTPSADTFVENHQEYKNVSTPTVEVAEHKSPAPSPVMDSSVRPITTHQYQPMAHVPAPVTKVPEPIAAPKPFVPHVDKPTMRSDVSPRVKKPANKKAASQKTAQRNVTMPSPIPSPVRFKSRRRVGPKSEVAVTR